MAEGQQGVDLDAYRAEQRAREAERTMMAVTIKALMRRLDVDIVKLTLDEVKAVIDEPMTMMPSPTNPEELIVSFDAKGEADAN